MKNQVLKNLPIFVFSCFAFSIIGYGFGYQAGPDQKTKELQSAIIQQQQLCHKALYTLSNMKQSFPHRPEKTAKQIAIERMLRN